MSEAGNVLTLSEGGVMSVYRQPSVRAGNETLVSFYLNGASCWTVHPFRARHLYLVPVRSSTPVSVTAALCRAAGQEKVTLSVQAGEETATIKAKDLPAPVLYS